MPERVDDSHHIAKPAVLQPQFACGYRGSNDKSPGLDPVRYDLILYRLQLIDPIDCQSRRADTRYFRAHLIQAVRKVRYLRFTSGRFDNGAALCKRRGHQHVRSAKHGRAEWPAQENFFASQTVRSFGDDIAVLEVDLCAEGLQALEVKVDRPVAYGTAARHGNFRPAATGQQRAENTNSSSHPADDFIFSDRIINDRRVYAQITVRTAGNFAAQTFKQFAAHGNI